MPVYERLSMVVSLALIGLALYFVIDLPARIVQVDIFGISVAPAISVRLLMVVLLGGLALTGTGTVVRSRPNERVSYLKPYWVNPMLITVLATLTLAQTGSALTWAIGLAITGILLWLSMLAEYYVLQSSKAMLNFYRLWSHGVSYALILAYAVFIVQLEISIAAKLVSLFVVSWMLAASVLKLYAPPEQTISSPGFIVALALSQLVWIFTYWPIAAIAVGLVAILAFHTLCGLLIAQQQNRFSKRIVVEYAVVAGIGLFVVVQFVG